MSIETDVLIIGSGISGAMTGFAAGFVLIRKPAGKKQARTISSSGR